MEPRHRCGLIHEQDLRCKGAGACAVQPTLSAGQLAQCQLVLRALRMFCEDREIQGRATCAQCAVQVPNELEIEQLAVPSSRNLKACRVILRHASNHCAQ